MQAVTTAERAIPPRRLLAQTVLQEAIFAALRFLGTLLIFVVHGYHPYADDAALYGAGIQQLLNPGLFRGGDTDFLHVHQGASIFEPLAAGIYRGLHLSTDWGLFLTQVLAAYAFLAGLDFIAVAIGALRRGRAMILCLA